MFFRGGLQPQNKNWKIENKLLSSRAGIRKMVGLIFAARDAGKHAEREIKRERQGRSRKREGELEENGLICQFEGTPSGDRS